MVALPNLIPITEAARKYEFDEGRLRQLIEAGKIRAGVAMGEVVVSEEELREQVTRKEDLPEYKQFDLLKGKPIWVSEAARKYNIPAPTLSTWSRGKNLIKILGIDGNKVMLDEQDVAYCSLIYHQRKGQGKWLFNADGTPYKPKTG